MLRFSFSLLSFLFLSSFSFPALSSLLTGLVCCAENGLLEGIWTSTLSGGSGPPRAPWSGTSSERSVDSGRRRAAAAAAGDGERRRKGLLLPLPRCSRLLCLLPAVRARRICFLEVDH